jgi:hypothetical protein
MLEVPDFVVGDQEKSSVRIEKERKALVGCTNRLYVNNRLDPALFRPDGVSDMPSPR